jgi:hypothetical protein
VTEVVERLVIVRGPTSRLEVFTLPRRMRAHVLLEFVLLVCVGGEVAFLGGENSLAERAMSCLRRSHIS